MIRSKYTIRMRMHILILFGLAIMMISCLGHHDKNLTDDSIDSHADSVEKEFLQLTKDSIKQIIYSKSDYDTNTSSANHDPYKMALDFKTKLSAKEPLSIFFDDNWSLIYHEDNRCDGSTDGKIIGLQPSQIDSLIILNVYNDGDGWACDKKEPNSYDLDFDLKKLIDIWDRFEIPRYENQDENIIYVLGAGESDYLKLHYNDSSLIVKLEYRSEDPG